VTVRFELTPKEVRALDLAGFIRVPLPSPVWLPDGNLATSVLVGRVLDEVRAYANVCRHQPVPLDVDDQSVLASDVGTARSSARPTAFASRGRAWVKPCSPPR
jgi:nitrite reductase/ring-hydroxylating ferredoxin subunit